MTNIQQNKQLIGLECSSISKKYEAIHNGYDFIGIHVLNITQKNEYFEKYTGLSDQVVSIHVEGKYFFIFQKKGILMYNFKRYFRYIGFCFIIHSIGFI